MRVRGQVVVVTGGAHGIGRALCERFHREGASRVVLADVDEIEGQKVARSVDGSCFMCDVTNEEHIRRVVEETEDRFGPIGLFCSNAGIAAAFDIHSANAATAPDEAWARSWAVNVMAHVYAARALIPRMKARGRGYFLNTVSAAGLLTQIGSAVYATTKHAAVGFAENVAIAHWDDGIRVSILCPQAVDTPMLRSLPPGPQSADGILSAADVAEAAISGLEDERFLILPHAHVARYMRKKVEDYDQWVRAMAKLQRTIRAQTPTSAAT
jgi:NAD(P)-dependent dehydrogenase (short-subunit alcohol dehydrogenase family)